MVGMLETFVRPFSLIPTIPGLLMLGFLLRMEKCLDLLSLDFLASSLCASSSLAFCRQKDNILKRLFKIIKVSVLGGLFRATSSLETSVGTNFGRAISCAGGPVKSGDGALPLASLIRGKLELAIMAFFSPPFSSSSSSSPNISMLLLLLGLMAAFFFALMLGKTTSFFFLIFGLSNNFLVCSVSFFSSSLFLPTLGNKSSS
mmetsp:Transcript_7694/g.13926  ORF Transcript_7694/g.13926 Transcript_7694/m.13926 type:complete len:202 (-) Transcript_7694:1339-1944(-)